jgi:hypothetical protein
MTMNYLVCKIVNGIPVPESTDILSEAEARAWLAELQSAEPAEQFVALAVL